LIKVQARIDPGGTLRMIMRPFPFGTWGSLWTAMSDFRTLLKTSTGSDERSADAVEEMLDT